MTAVAQGDLFKRLRDRLHKEIGPRAVSIEKVDRSAKLYLFPDASLQIECDTMYVSEIGNDLSTLAFKRTGG